MQFCTRKDVSEIIHGTELEDRTSARYLRLRHSRSNGTSSIEIDKQCGDEILSHVIGVGQRPPTMQESDCSLAKPVTEDSILQVIFLNSARINGATTSRLKINPSILEGICSKLDIGLPFLDGLLVPSIWSKQAGISFNRYGKDREVRAIYGFYHYFNEWHLGPLHTWFSYDIKSGVTTYLLVDCPKNVVETIRANAEDQADCYVHRPFAIDFLISEQCLSWRKDFINDKRKEIFEWHEEGGGMDAPLKDHVTQSGGLRRLHQLSRTWNMLYEDLADFEERQDALIEAAHKVKLAGNPDTDAAVEAIKFLKIRNHLRRRWVSSFGERTKLIINFVFSAANQRNAEVNREIARLTADIARETQRDSSSMITIATMTMIFLPATFVCALFSMVFFDRGIDNTGQEIIYASPRLWYFPAITVPLTLLVYLWYKYWHKRRQRKMEARRNSSLQDLERGIALVTV